MPFIVANGDDPHPEIGTSVETEDREGGAESIEVWPMGPVGEEVDGRLRGVQVVRGGALTVAEGDAAGVDAGSREEVGNRCQPGRVRTTRPDPGVGFAEPRRALSVAGVRRSGQPTVRSG
jgi:hypothetical protein